MIHSIPEEPARGYGLADREANRQAEPDSLFRRSSLSKPFTTATTLRLVEDGRLTLDTRAFQILDHLKPAPNASVDHSSRISQTHSEPPCVK